MLRRSGSLRWEATNDYLRTTCLPACHATHMRRTCPTLHLPQCLLSTHLPYHPHAAHPTRSFKAQPCPQQTNTSALPCPRYASYIFLHSCLPFYYYYSTFLQRWRIVDPRGIRMCWHKAHGQPQGHGPSAGRSSLVTPPSQPLLPSQTVMRACPRDTIV